jgi:hypothetical protein
MAITVEDFLTRVAYDLHEEDNTFPSGLWTQAEVIQYIEHAERDFYRQTGIIKVDVTVPVGAGTQILFTKPSNMMDIERISFNKKRLRRVTTWDLQREDPRWRVNPNGKTKYYHEDHLPSVLQFEFDRVPATGGSYRIIGDLLPPSHGTTTNTTTTITTGGRSYPLANPSRIFPIDPRHGTDTDRITQIPFQSFSESTTKDVLGVDVIWEPYIRWEVLSLCLGKDGDNQDLARSAYAHKRYLLGVSLAKRLSMGTETDIMSSAKG